MLSTGAFNALLKTLEEPPEHVKFILATTEPQKLPATILSRCQRFDFKKISKDNIISYRKNKYNYEVLVNDRKKVKKNNSNLVIDKATLEDIMLLIVKGEK